MHCNYLDHGLVIKSSKIVIPCCNFEPSSEWIKNNHLSDIDFENWHKLKQFDALKKIFADGKFPSECSTCKLYENNGRDDSLRKNFNRISNESQHDDIFLEITPGTTCNFACFSCSPLNSSTIQHYQKKANILNEKNFINIENFDFLNKIKDRIVSVTLLGGESFYDKNCLKFLHWANENLSCKLIIFTNGSYINFDIIKIYKGKVQIIFSLDAIEKEAEYIRFGTNWDKVKQNYLKVKNLTQIETAVLITESVYNAFTIHNILDFLLENFPTYLIFNIADQERNYIDIIPISFRKEIIDNLYLSIKKVLHSNIEKDQKISIAKSLNSIIERLKSLDWNEKSYRIFQNYTIAMNKAMETKEIPNFIEKLLNYTLVKNS